MSHYLTTLKGAQPTRMGEAEMDKLTQIFAYFLRKGEAKNFSEAHRLAINNYHRNLKSQFNKEEKKITYKDLKDAKEG